MGDQFREARNEYADSLFALAKRAAEAGQLSLAFQWATETVRENPDHADARRVLGYEQRDGQWLTPYGAKMVDAGKIVAIRRPGWVSSDGRQVGRSPQANDKNGWQVRTDHFLVTTNHSLDAAAELAARLERLHQVWRQLFAGFYLPEREVRQLFAGERDARERSRGRFACSTIATATSTSTPSAAASRGSPRRSASTSTPIREAHFFAGDEQDAGTLYHEAVHQLFQESRPAAKQVGDAANFWIIEGVATYFETLTRTRRSRRRVSTTRSAKSTAGRLPAARERLLADGFYVPLAELDAARQGRRAAAPGDCQAVQPVDWPGGVLDGRRRRPLSRAAGAVLGSRLRRPRQRPSRSPTRPALSYAELDAAYRRYMESLP